MKFLDALNLNIDDKWNFFLKELGIDATEKIKLVEDDEWDDPFKSLEWSKWKGEVSNVRWKCRRTLVNTIHL